MAYVDLNPIRAGIAQTPEESEHTSIAARIEAKNKHQRRQQVLRQHARLAPSLIEAEELENAHSESSAHWCLPIEECLADIDSLATDPLTLDEYLQLVDDTGRLIAEGKRGFIPQTMQPILDRLQLASNRWSSIMQQAGEFCENAVGNTIVRAKEASRQGLRWICQRTKLYHEHQPPPSG